MEEPDADVDCQSEGSVVGGVVVGGEFRQRDAWGGAEVREEARDAHSVLLIFSKWLHVVPMISFHGSDWYREICVV